MIINNNNDINDINDIENKFGEIIPCNFEFILVIIKVDDITYDITNILNNHNNYYYVVNNNLFDKIFMEWLCLHHLKIKLNDYSVSFLDNSAIEQTIDNTKYLKLFKTEYTINNLI